MSRLSEMLEQLDSEALAKCTGTPNESECFDRFVTAKQMVVENYHPLSQLSAEAIAFIGVAGCLVIILHIFFPVRSKHKVKQ